jgi:precorrin-6Y C5,15-methyltransferase (decarboxylating)
MNRFYVIGISDMAPRHLSRELEELIASHRVFSGGLRHRELVRHLLPPESTWIPVEAPLDAVFERYKLFDDIIVFASGDPLFFGFAATIRKRLPEACIEVFPTFHSLQTMACRLVLPYNDMRTVSLTGRSWHEFDRALIERAEMIGVLTDHVHSPAAIAQRMRDYNYHPYIMHIGERLGHGEMQRIRSMTLAEVIETGSFASPNCLILCRHGEWPSVRPFGIPDRDFLLLNGRERMITKMPIRLLTLQMMNLYGRHHFWDVGFCTGSVAIEAKMQFPHLHVTAFEVREEGRQLMEANSCRLGVPGINTVIADFLTVPLSEMVKPDAVFIGGHGGKLKPIVRRVVQHLATDGIIVFNSVSEESRLQFAESAEESGMKMIRQTVVTIEPYNTITICCCSAKIPE